MRRLALSFLLVPGLLPLSLTGCGAGYSPNTYASTAAQQQAAVERGVIIGVRPVLISPNGAVGAATGGAAGGVAGAQLPGSTVATAFGAIGGTLVGGVAGTAAEQAVGNTKGWEYIVQETGNKLVSITQTSKTALPIGLNVLVIAGTQQARIVPDYTVQPAAAPAAKPAGTSAPQTAAASNGSAATEINITPLLPEDSAVVPFQVTPINAASDPAAPPAPGPAPAGAVAAPPAAAAAAVKEATPATVSNKSPATETPAAGPTVTPAQAAPSTPAVTPPVSSSAAP